MKKIICLSALVVSASLLTGCGMVKGQMTSNEDYQLKASRSIGVEPKEVFVSNIDTGVDAIHFKAQARGKTYQCYFTTLVATDSSTICNSADGVAHSEKTSTSSAGKSCNALEKAAGQCN